MPSNQGPSNQPVVIVFVVVGIGGVDVVVVVVVAAVIDAAVVIARFARHIKPLPSFRCDFSFLPVLFSFSLVQLAKESCFSWKQQITHQGPFFVTSLVSLHSGLARNEAQSMLALSMMDSCAFHTFHTFFFFFFLCVFCVSKWKIDLARDVIRERTLSRYSRTW